MNQNRIILCRPKRLPRELLVRAAQDAVALNPANHPPVGRLAGVLRGLRATPQRIAMLTNWYWGARGVKLTVGFLDNPPDDLRRRIIAHMNAWNRDANVNFVAAGTDPDVRIARDGGEDGGYWSYVGTQIRHIPANEATMNLEGFTMRTPESEFHRVVRHETGHTLGFPHEHMRRELVNRIDPRKAIAYFREADGWSEQDTINQVLTPLEDTAIKGTVADPRSIMCYQIPGEITKDGQPIVGGLDLDESDYVFAGRIYPKARRRAVKKN